MVLSVLKAFLGVVVAQIGHRACFGPERDESAEQNKKKNHNNNNNDISSITDVIFIYMMCSTFAFRLHHMDKVFINLAKTYNDRIWICNYEYSYSLLWSHWFVLYAHRICSNQIFDHSVHRSEENARNSYIYLWFSWASRRERHDDIIVMIIFDHFEVHSMHEDGVMPCRNSGKWTNNNNNNK